MNLRIKKLFGLFALATLLAAPESLFAQFPGFGGSPGGSRTRGGTRGGSSGNSAALQAQNKVLAVADERSNSLIILAPEDQIPMIEELIGELDDDVDDVTEVRIIKLENADPTEVSEQINQLFGSSNQQQNQQQRFGPAAFFASRFGGGGGGSQSNNSNERGKRSTQEVIAVPDPRTASLIISAPRQMIETVENLVKQLDSNSAQRQKVFVFSLEHADVNNAAEILRAMFEGENTRTTQTTAQDNALRNRSGTFGTAGNANANIGAAGGGRGGGTGGIGGR